MLKERKLLMISIAEIILICLLSVFLTFKTICISTISENYINTTITNQIIDFVIDHYTDLKSEQLQSLQDDLSRSRALYRFNENAFDTAIQDIKKQSEFKMERETIDDFAETCIVIMEEHLDRDLNEEEQNNIELLLEKDSLWSRFLQNMNTKIDEQSFFVKIYDLSSQMVMKIILIILVLLGMTYILVYGKGAKIIYLMIISLFTALFHYLMLLMVYMITPFLGQLISIENLQIVMDPILYIAIFWLIIALTMVYIYLKREYF